MNLTEYIFFRISLCELLAKIYSSP